MSDFSDPFTAMAERITLNAGQQYGGAFVIVPPGEEPKPEVMLILDNSGDPSVFWGSVMTRCQIALEQLKQDQEQQGGFGMMGRR